MGEVKPSFKSISELISHHESFPGRKKKLDEARRRLAEDIESGRLKITTKEMVVVDGSLMEFPSCPFCGFHPDPTDPDCIYPISPPDFNGSQVYNVVCYESGGGCGASVLGWSRNEAILRWCRRKEG